jgi:DNA-binding IclR family transcriptional regulator
MRRAKKSEPAVTQSSLAKGLLVLREVGRLAGNDGAKLAEIARSTGLNKATAHRMLTELRRAGLIEHLSPAATYRLGQSVLALAAEYHASLNLRESALRLLRPLSAATGLTAHLAIRDHDEVVYIEKVESTSNVRIASGVGWRGRLHSTALGKAMLAQGGSDLMDLAIRAGLTQLTARTIVAQSALEIEIELTRNRGFAVDDLENQDDVRCIGAAVCDQNGEPIAAISISGTTSQLPKKRIGSVGVLVRDTARQLSEQLGYRVD